MNRVVLFAVLLLFSQSSIAADSSLYFGIKYGPMDPDWAGISSGNSVGIDAGYMLGDLFGVGEYATFAIEAEYTTVVSKGNAYVPGGEWDINTLALYFVVRSQGEIYGKLKGGFIREDASVNLPGFADSATETDQSGGIGIGWRLDQIGLVELELTGIEKDINYLSIGYYHRF